MEKINKIEISKKQLLKNLEEIKIKSGGKKICAMVKANAYGLGINQICSILNGKVEFFGVANINEALEVRKLCPTSKILIVGKTNAFELCQKFNISFVIDDVAQLLRLVKFVKQAPGSNCINIHIKINSGMNRLGVKSEKELKEIFKICEKYSINVEGISTHFATADCDEKFFEKQKRKFENALRLVPKRINPIVHVGGSAAAAKVCGANMLRVGIGLYGFMDGANVKSVVKLKSKIIKIFDVEKGERVGYANAFIAKQPTKVAILPIGYADGVSRNLSGKIDVVVCGKKRKTIGKICMDMMFVDVTGLNVLEGQEVVVLYDVKKWAQILNTTCYEILTNLNLVR